MLGAGADPNALVALRQRRKGEYVQSTALSVAARCGHLEVRRDCSQTPYVVCRLSYVVCRMSYVVCRMSPMSYVPNQFGVPVDRHRELARGVGVGVVDIVLPVTPRAHAAQVDAVGLPRDHRLREAFCSDQRRRRV